MPDPAVVGEGPEEDEDPSQLDEKAARDFAESSRVEPIPSDIAPLPATEGADAAAERPKPAPPAP